LRQASVEGVTAAVPIAQRPETAAKTDRHKLEKRASPFSSPTLSTPSTDGVEKGLVIIGEA
jgi:hypothetical protein